MNGSAKIGTALVGGYLLGRTKKAKLAIGLGMFLAGKKIPLDPKQLGRMLADSPLLGTLNDQVRKELVGATKSAATQALTQRATGLADSLQRRTRELEAPQGEEAGDEEEDEDLGEEDKGRDAGAGEPDEERPAPRKKTAAKAPAKSTAGTAGRGGTRRSPSGGAGRKTASTTRKTASGARKTASGTRKSRGGDRG